jgi:hypothetical protein
MRGKFCCCRGWPAAKGASSAAPGGSMAAVLDIARPIERNGAVPFSLPAKHRPGGAASIVAGTIVCLLGCATRDHAPAAKASPPIASIASPCVLHASEGKQHTHKVRLPGGALASEEQHGSCAANAECIATEGQENPGDGFVHLVCTDRTCTCSVELLPSSPTKPSTLTFSLSSPCTTSSQALQLIVERCMPGMTVTHP